MSILAFPINSETTEKEAMFYAWANEQIHPDVLSVLNLMGIGPEWQVRLSTSGDYHIMIRSRIPDYDFAAIFQDERGKPSIVFVKGELGKAWKLEGRIS